MKSIAPHKIPSRKEQFFPIESFPSAQVLAASSTKHAGNMSVVYGDSQTAVANRRAFLQSLGISLDDIVCAQQTHSDNAVYVSRDDSGKGAKIYATAIKSCDALFTDVPGLALTIGIADCLGIFLYMPSVPAIGLVHAGWLGTKKEVTRRTIEKMREKFNPGSGPIYAALSPAIRACCYQVGAEFKEYFPREIRQADGFYYADLARANIRQLLESGVKEANIWDSKVCTSCRDQDFFSYRRQGKDCGRTMAVMMLRKG